jgi:hypothetical protein
MSQFNGEDLYNAILKLSSGVNISGNYPVARYYSATEPQPTVNNDGSQLVKYQFAWDLSLNKWYSWTGSAWEAMA